MFALSPSQKSAFEAVIIRQPDEVIERLIKVREPACAAAFDGAPHSDFGLPSRNVDGVLGSGPDQNKIQGLRQALVARWALMLPERVAGMDLPERVLDLYPDWMDRLAAFLAENAGDYDADAWAADVRLCVGLSVPGSQNQIIDLSSRLGPRQMLRSLTGRRLVGELGSVAAWVGARGWRPWLEVRNVSGHLEDFTEAGCDRLWACGAALLRSRPDMAGMMGASVLHDPGLTKIRPELACLREKPLANGAFIVQGSAEMDTRASPASPDPIEKKEYRARSWIVAWPREALIDWAEKSGLI